jgi:hypothetical protein
MEHFGTTTFADWLRRVFDHPVTHPEWYWNSDADLSEPAPQDCVAHLTRQFEQPELVLAPYSDAQIDQGLWYLVSSDCSKHMFSLIEPWVPWSARQRGIRSMAALFERLFARRCSEHLSHLDEPRGNPLNRVCYTWWDIFPACGRPGNPTYAEVDAELLAVMKRTLALDSLACRESALHGLGHWEMYYPDIVRPIIDEFLSNGRELRPELREYAERARHGYVQ